MNIVRFVSPMACLMATVIIFIASVIIPSGYYSELMQEANYMFGNVKLIGFFVIHVLFYVSGLFLARNFFKMDLNGGVKIYNFKLTLYLLLAFIFLSVYSAYIIIGNNPSILINLISGDGAETKDTLDSTGALGLSNPILLAVLSWSLVEINNLSNVSRLKVYIYRASAYVAFLVLLFSFSIKLSRFELMPLFFSVICIYLLNNDYKYNAKKSIYAFLFTILFLFIVVFVLFSYLRGVSDFEGHLVSFLGYGPASYNRLAALLDGNINFPYAGTGSYAFAFLLNFPIVGDFLEIRSIFNLPTSFDVWRSEFYAISSSGLDSSFNWISALGYIYADISFFSLGYIFILGLINRWLWCEFVKKSPYGIILYPWFAFCTIFWFGFNYVVFPKVVIFILVAMFVDLYNRKFIINSY